MNSSILEHFLMYNSFEINGTSTVEAERSQNNHSINHMTSANNTLFIYDYDQKITTHSPMLYNLNHHLDTIEGIKAILNRNLIRIMI